MLIKDSLIKHKQKSKCSDVRLRLVEENVIKSLKHFSQKMTHSTENGITIVKYENSSQKYYDLIQPSDFARYLGFNYKSFEKKITKFKGISTCYYDRSEGIIPLKGYYIIFQSHQLAQNFCDWFNNDYGKKAKLLLLRHGCF